MQQTQTIPASGIENLKNLLKGRGYSFAEKEHAHFEARGNGCTITVYRKGPKMLLQGAHIEAELSAIQTLPGFEGPSAEPALVKALSDIRNLPETPKDLPSGSWIGTDESGKGDYFGPLVTAGVCLNAVTGAILRSAGVADCKVLQDSTVRNLRDLILSTPGITSRVSVLVPENYNSDYAKFQNLNLLLANQHAVVIAQLAEANPNCESSLTDQFAANRDTLEHACRNNKVPASIKIRQQPKAESDIAVAAASVLARAAFLDWFELAGKTLPEKPPLGGGDQATECAKRLCAKFELRKLVKTHFRNTEKVTRGDKTTETTADYDLEPQEIQKLRQLVEDGLKTTNGDTHPVTITVRQLELLLNHAKLP
jgi:ribonuclease HIII